jgi:hypothetical protein
MSGGGYVMIFVGGIERYRFEHDLVVERALGHALRPPALVHHVNRDRTDNRNANLVLCPDDAYHLELHRKLRVLRAGGNPWTDRVCSECGPRKADLFPWQRRKITAYNPNGYGSTCMACCRRLRRERRAA